MTAQDVPMTSIERPAASSPQPVAAPVVLSERRGSIGIITLNRPKVINALNLAMVRQIADCLADFESETTTAIVLRGAGERGFCAGGDMVSASVAAQAGEADAARFFTEEYALNLQISKCVTPVVAIMDGIVLGGGVGLSGHASHRVVTETARVGMPEVGIGFIPDVGGTWLLSRANGQLGTFVALTGEHLDAAGAIACNLADWQIERSSIDDLVSRLAQGQPVDDAIVTIGGTMNNDHGWLRDRPWIDRCFAADDATAIVNALCREIDGRAIAAAATIRTRSPLAVTVTLRALRIARQLGDLQSCLALEHSAVMQFLDTPDLHEGVRAALIDKDRNPRWRPDRLEDVTSADVDPFFEAFVRSNQAG